MEDRLTSEARLDWRYWLRVAGVAIAYVLAAEFGLSQAHVAEQVSPVWPPTGIALAAVILWGVRMWPAVAAGAFIANLNHLDIEFGALIAGGIAIGNTLEAVVGGFFLRKLVNIRPQLDRLADVIGLAVIGGAMCTMISATIGVSSLVLGGIEPVERFVYLWRTWWLGDAMGALVVAPLILTWLAGDPQRLSKRRMGQAIALLGLLAVVGAVVFLAATESAAQLKYAVFPFFIWAALGFGQRVTSTAVAIAATLAVLGATSRPIADPAIANEQLLLLQTFMGVGSMTALALGSIMAERNRAQRELATHREHLSDLVAERTEQLEETHQRLRLTERMAALGTLSAGLGHDIGNLLLPMRLRLDAMEARGVTSQTRDDVLAIRQCADYLQRLANGLRLFALDPDDPRAATQVTNLDEWWNDVQPFMHNAVPRRAKIACDFESGLVVRIARANLTQAVFNLVQNAGDALARSDGGVIRIWAKALAGGRVQVGVSDNGPGMSNEVRQRCLEPFFTTKTRSISTGLGLALVHGIVQKAGGTIEVESEIGAGSTFTLTLQAASMPEQGVAGAKPQAACGGAGGAGPGARALVNVTDARNRAYIDTLLQSMAFEVVRDEQNAEDASLWIVETSGDGVRRALEHLRKRVQGRVIVLGNGVPSPDDPRIAWLGAEPKPQQIRAALYRAAQELSQST